MKKTILYPLIPVLSVVLITICNCGGQDSHKSKHTAAPPIPAHKVVKQLPIPTYNVYIENSASMYGYVKGVTEFEQSVYNYLSDIKINDLTDSLNLYYINSKPIKINGSIADFIEKLEPESFKAKGGNLGTTDISNVIKSVLANNNNNTVSVLVSDFIFSPGYSKNAEEYLINQQIGLKSTFAEYLKLHPDHAVIVYHLESKFDGIYYDRNDKRCPYKGERPFYIWIIGDKNHLANLEESCPVDDFKGSGVDDIFSIIRGGVIAKYAIKYGSGNFRLDKKDTKSSIVKARKDTKGINKGKLRFSVNVDFSDLLCSDEYLLDANNYTINDKDYDLVIEKLKSNEGYTHILKLSSDIVKPTTLKISLKSRKPKWITEVNDDEGIGLSAENSDKTFGFKHLIAGVYEAFTKDGEEYTTITINVNK